MIEDNHKKGIAKHFGKVILTELIKIEGIREKVKMDIYDGYAEGETKDGKHIMLEYPLAECVRDSKELCDSVMDYLDDITEKGQITPVQCMQTFSSLYIDGVLIPSKSKDAVKNASK